MKIGLLITARLKSSRLPFKLLRDLNGYSIIEHVINRSKKLSDIEDIVLCTSINQQDKPLVEIAKKNDIYYFLGSEDDVLQRLCDCAKFFGFDYVLSITGENPIFSIDHTNLMINRIKTLKEDFIYIEGLPIGTAVYGINVKALKTVCEYKDEIDTEIWGPLINRPEIFKVGKLIAEDFYYRPNLRLTNDYFEDFQMMNKIFCSFNSCSTPSLFSVLEFLDNNREILDTNKERTQLSLDDDTTKRIDEFFKHNHHKIIKIKNKNYSDDI
ncbi:cytidylyltransferase domain-containing protein [Sphingobacterium siyangense]|uniref:cytidylyltransferase domain-containing protein n=1 Tax=Sphingobacterium siyangense TaxID=459529 RepID=UPI003DA52045